MSNQYIIYPGEAETLIQSLKTISYEEYGLEKWFTHHGHLNKLNIQAVISARSRADEFIKDLLISYKKLPLLINDLIAVELWKEKVYPLILNSKTEPTTTFPIYTIMYHELLVANLLETVTFHSDAAENLGDYVIDLSDWCYRSLCHLIAHHSSSESKAEFLRIQDKIDIDSNINDLNRQRAVINFNKSMKAISIIRYLLEHSLGSNNILPVGLARRLLHNHEIPLILCQLIEKTPWIADVFDKQINQTSRFIWQEDGTWMSECENKHVMHKLEGQIWLCLCQVLLTNNSPIQFDSSVSHRRTALLKLRVHLTEYKIDSMPILIDLRRYLEELTLKETNGSRGQYKIDSYLIDLVPECWEFLTKKYQKKWKDLCDHFLKQSESKHGKEASMKAAAQWASVFSEEHLGQLCLPITNADNSNINYKIPLCPVCGKTAVKRCSRCQNEWYCRRECQVKHWPKHNKVCDIQSEAMGSEKLSK